MTKNPREADSRRARALLQDVVFMAAVDKVVARNRELWEDPASTLDIREMSWHRLQAIRDVIRELDSAANDFAVNAYNNRHVKN